jgi:hypothetical protein
LKVSWQAWYAERTAKKSKKMRSRVSTTAPTREEIIRDLRQAIVAGKHWYLALLEAIGRWTWPEESASGGRGGRTRYMIDGEAFDWPALAQRLCQGVDGLVPEVERRQLVLWGRPAIALSESELRKRLGASKHRAYLNFFYGVLVERALLARAEEELRKEAFCRGYRRVRNLERRAYLKVYGEALEALLLQFQEEKGVPPQEVLTPGHSKEFTYWLFKRRMQLHDPAKVASDTKKGLEWLYRQWQQHHPDGSVNGHLRVIEAEAWVAEE